MPFDALVISIAVTAVFFGFAIVLAWADYQTSRDKRKVPERKRRALKIAPTWRIGSGRKATLP
jgi:hypothetical protein